MLLIIYVYILIFVHQAVQHTKAEDLTNCLVELLKKSKIDINRMISFTSDGASVMVGHKSGVGSRISAIMDAGHLVRSHCVVHREALAVKDVLNVSCVCISRAILYPHHFFNYIGNQSATFLGY